MLKSFKPLCVAAILIGCDFSYMFVSPLLVMTGVLMALVALAFMIFEKLECLQKEVRELKAVQEPERRVTK